MNYEFQIQLDEFRGPLDKLLELIEKKKLEVRRVSLAEVTEEYLRYLESLERVTPRILADFIWVAARLILIKSHTLLPQLELTAEEEGEIADLEERLKLYRGFKDADAHLRRMWGEGQMFSRSYLASMPPGFYLTEEVSPEDIAREIARLGEELVSAKPRLKEEEITLVSLEAKIEELIVRMDKAIKARFNDIADGKERGEVIVLFLALLHLLKENIISVEQGDLFSDIHMFKEENGEVS